MLKKVVFFIMAVFFICGSIWSQEFGFGFGFDDEETESGGAVSGTSANANNEISVSISGEVSAAIVGFLDDFSEGAENINTRDMFIFSGKLNFLSQSSFAEGIINMKLVPAFVPVSINEAYIRAFFGNFDFTAGLLKLAWGKADQFGPLDIINMPDSSRMFIEMADNSNLMDVKIANPIIHASYRFGMFSKFEGVFLPSFEIVSMAVSSAFGETNEFLSLVRGPVSERWIPPQIRELNDKVKEDNGKLIIPDTSKINFAQAGLRFTTTIGSVDLGAQYFYGRMFQPVVKTTYDFINSKIKSVELIFNKYHQIGLDYAQDLFGFNVRAEVAANITEDINGDDGYIYNPSLAWSFGFDKDLFWGINLNLQVNESIRLMNDKVGSSELAIIEDPLLPIPSMNPNFDIEADMSVTATRLTATLSKKFLRDELELRTAVVWGIEDNDCVIIPALIWTKDDFRAALSGGFFAGDSKGQLGQYKDNNFLKISVTYMF